MLLPRQTFALESDGLDTDIKAAHHLGGQIIGEIAAKRCAAIKQQTAVLLAINLRDNGLCFIGDTIKSLGAGRLDFPAVMRGLLLQTLPAFGELLELLLLLGTVRLTFQCARFGLQRRTLLVNLGLGSAGQIGKPC